MPALVCDRPPSASNIVARVQEQALPFGLGWTTRVPSCAIRAEVKHRVTNTSPDLSLARARLQSLVSEATSELRRYSRFAVGWDGYSGEPISPIAIALAEFLVVIVAQMKGTQRLV